jgi:hypothetical protein
MNTIIKIEAEEDHHQNSAGVVVLQAISAEWVPASAEACREAANLVEEAMVVASDLAVPGMDLALALVEAHSLEALDQAVTVGATHPHARGSNALSTTKLHSSLLRCFDLILSFSNPVASRLHLLQHA